MTTYLFTCKPAFEKVLSREIELYGLKADCVSSGCVVSGPVDGQPAVAEACFAVTVLENPRTIKTDSGGALVSALADAFSSHIAERRIEAAWPRVFFTAGEDERLLHHAKTIEERWLEKMRKKMSRVIKLSEPGIPRGPEFSDGLFVHFTDFNHAQLAFRGLSQGQQRMKMDPDAPSRSYLKIEEAFHVLGVAPAGGERVVDLGAAPGGWSLGALKRGAFVAAVDNGPLREPVASHPNVEHLREDALRFHPEDPVDWLFCDVVEDPDMILVLIEKWLVRKWCRRFIVNLKVGRADPIALIRKIRDPQSGLVRHCRSLILRQLYHDREEITLLGE